MLYLRKSGLKEIVSFPYLYGLDLLQRSTTILVGISFQSINGARNNLVHLTPSYDVYLEFSTFAHSVRVEAVTDAVV